MQMNQTKIRFGSQTCSISVKYSLRAIITHGLYIFYPIFEDNFFVSKEIFSENSVINYGYYSRADYDCLR